MKHSEAVVALQERFAELGLEARPLMTYLDGKDSGQLWVRVPAERLREVMTFLKQDPRCRFEQLCDVTCIDYLNDPVADERFAVIYSLLSLSRRDRLWVKVFVNDPEPTVPSLCPIWRGAEWLEREVYDMFGIRFDGHPDLRRILLPANFASFPLRKDYPLRGLGEREQFEVITRETTDAAL